MLHVIFHSFPGAQRIRPSRSDGPSDSNGEAEVPMEDEDRSQLKI